MDHARQVGVSSLDDVKGDDVGRLVRDRYRDFLLGRDLSDRTIELYTNRLGQARRWCDSNGRKLAGLSPGDMREMGDEVWPLAHSSRRQARLAVRYYFEMIGRSDGGPYKAIRMPKKPRGRNRAMSREDARAVAKKATGWYPQGTAVLAGMYMALRASEIAGIRWDRFDVDMRWYTVLGKGDVTSSIPVHPTMRREFKERRTAHLYLFPGARGRSYVTAATVWNWTREVCEAADVRGVSPHVLRHTAITELNDRTRDLRAAQDFARHSRPETTALYTRVDSERLMDAVELIDYSG